MPTMKDDDILRVEPEWTREVTEDGTTKMGDELEILGSAEVDTPAGEVPWNQNQSVHGRRDSRRLGAYRERRPDRVVRVARSTSSNSRTKMLGRGAILGRKFPTTSAAIAEMRSATSSGQQAGDPPLSGPSA